LYAKTLAKNKEDKKAKAIVQKAIQEFVGTSEEGSVMLANSEIAIEGGDVKKAINILKGVQPKSSTF
jgi:tetratricopeptide repeat protein 21B